MIELGGQYFTTREAAIRMHVCVRMVQYLCAKRGFGVRFGRGTYLISETEIETYIQELEMTKMKNEISPVKIELAVLRCKQNQVGEALERQKKAIFNALGLALQELMVSDSINDACIERAKKRLAGTQENVIFLTMALESLTDQITAAEARLQLPKTTNFYGGKNE